jgi:SAM-dependent methyltransferase
VKRVPEPELMLDPAQAEAYARADFTEPHERFAALLRERLADLPDAGAALDLGCGPGDPTLRLAQALPGWTFEGVDGSPPMLAHARAAAARAGLAARLRFHEARLPDVPAALAGRRFALVLSNSLLHHLPAPDTLWAAVRRFAAPGARVFAMDLLRPASVRAARDLVDRHAAGEPELLRRDFCLDALRCEPVSDRHWIAWGALG